MTTMLAIERTDQGDQIVLPGMATTREERIASVRRLMSEAQHKALKAEAIGDRQFADAQRAELERLRGILRTLYAQDRPAQANLL
jgi:hypothetical protein